MHVKQSKKRLHQQKIFNSRFWDDMKIGQNVGTSLFVTRSKSQICTFRYIVQGGIDSQYCNHTPAGPCIVYPKCNFEFKASLFDLKLRQLCVLQSCSSSDDPRHKESWLQVLVLDWLPPLHVLEQVPHGPQSFQDALLKCIIMF